MRHCAAQCTEPKPQATGDTTASSTTTGALQVGPHSSEAKYLGCYKDRRAGNRVFPSRTWVASLTLDKCVQLARAPRDAASRPDRKTIRTAAHEPSKLIGLQNGERATLSISSTKQFMQVAAGRHHH